MSCFLIVMLSVIMLSVIMLSVIMLSVVMLNVVAPLLRPEPTVPSLTISIGPSDERVHPSPKK